MIATASTQSTGATSSTSPTAPEVVHPAASTQPRAPHGERFRLLAMRRLLAEVSV
jgi:hypothetical protein